MKGIKRRKSKIHKSSEEKENKRIDREEESEGEKMADREVERRENDTTLID
jgi:hypothetical protein